MNVRLCGAPRRQNDMGGDVTLLSSDDGGAPALLIAGEVAAARS